MNFISIEPSIKCIDVKAFTKDEEIALRSSESIKVVVGAVRSGNTILKTANYYVLAHGVAKDGADKTTRCNANLVSNNKVCVDIDDMDMVSITIDKLRGNEEALGILRVEYSCSMKLHLFVRIIDGLTIDETMDWWDAFLGMKTDHIKDLARAVFLTPNEDCIYCHDDYYESIVEPIRFENLPDIGFDIETVREGKKNKKAKNLVENNSMTDFASYSPTIQMASNICSDYQSTYEDNAEELKYLIDKKIVPAQIDITGKEEDWFQISVVLAKEMGEDGREYFHKVSQFYPNYSITETNEKYNHAMNTCYNYNMGSFIHIMYSKMQSDIII